MTKTFKSNSQGGAGIWMQMCRDIFIATKKEEDYG